MVTEDYCSYEVSKLLKEKGFDEFCDDIYIILPNGDYRWSKIDYPHKNSVNMKPSAIICPTHQMAMKWLREKGIIITLNYALNYDSKTAVYWGEITDVSNVTNGRKSTLTCNTYEQAVEAALKYALENLI